MALRYIAPALAVVGSAAAACSGTTTISNSADAAALSTCFTYSGDIAIATGVSDDIALDGVRRISGSLIVKNNQDMSSLSADSLSQIDDSFVLSTVSALSTLNFPSLTSVDTVQWAGLPQLSGLSFTSKLQQVGTLNIQNTVLQSLEGIDLEIVDTLTLISNVYLTDITMQLGNASDSINIYANGDNTRVSFPNLIWANNISIGNAAEVNLQSLVSTNSSLGFYENYFDSFEAPNVTNVGGGLTFVGNNDVTNISFPSLRQINGGFGIANNTDLKNINGFPRLARIGGDVGCTGEFKSLSLPELSDVRGAFKLASKEDITSACNHFKPLSTGRANVIKGVFACRGKVQNADASNTVTGGGSGTGGGSSSSSSGAANPIYISGATGVMGVIAAIFGML